MLIIIFGKKHAPLSAELRGGAKAEQAAESHRPAETFVSANAHI